MTRKTGEILRQTIGGEEVGAFVPFPLPPSDPPLAVDAAMQSALQRAEQELSRLRLAGELVPSLDWFIYGFVRKEAVVSSQIEGTQATLVDLLAFEADTEWSRGGESADLREVCNYLEALELARAESARPGGLPLSMRLLHETHRRLMQGARGGAKQPGEVRRSQSWIGGTRPGNAYFVPPPPDRVPELLGELETYLHAENGRLHPLLRTGLAHVQFETIHPYLDGNGRIGRLLITLLLEHWGLLDSPLLYLSLYLKRHREDYYRLLSAVRTEGDWEAWLFFFLEGVAVIATEAVEAARDLSELVSRDRRRLLAAATSTVTAARLLELLPEKPVLSVQTATEALGTTKPTTAKAIGFLVGLGILQEVTGRQRGRVYRYAAYLERLRVGTDLP